MKWKAFNLLLLVLPQWAFTQALDSLSLQAAVAEALQNNHQLKIAGNTRNLTSVAANWGNAGLLPTLTASGSAVYNLTDTRLEFANDAQPAIDRAGAQSTNVQGGVSLNYTLFDGFGNWYTWSRLNKQEDQADATFKLETENTMLQVVRSYYELATADDQVNLVLQAVDVSLDRYQRALLRAQTGVGSDLERFNAAVDLKNDSITLLQAQMQRRAASRNLSLLLGRSEADDLQVQRGVEQALPLSFEQLRTDALANNAALLQTALQEEVRKLELQEAQSDYYPQLDMNVGYNLSQNENEASLFILQRNNGLTAGLSLRWNLFDGYRTPTRVQQVRLQLQSSAEQKELAKLQLNRDLNNAWDQYQTALYVYQVQQRNLATAELNFQRSVELSKRGQITGTQFREAQLNYLRAQQNRLNARYQIKLAETELKRLAGLLLS